MHLHTKKQVVHKEVKMLSIETDPGMIQIIEIIKNMKTVIITIEL